MNNNITFKKSGKEIIEAASRLMGQLNQRLDRRNGELDKLLNDRKRLRSYLIRSTQQEFYGHGRGSVQLFSKDDISSEEKEEIRQMCTRVYEIEQEIHRLNLVCTHMDNDEQFELSFEDLVAYGFEAKIPTSET